MVECFEISRLINARNQSCSWRILKKLSRNDEKSAHIKKKRSENFGQKRKKNWLQDSIKHSKMLEITLLLSLIIHHSAIKTEPLKVPKFGEIYMKHKIINASHTWCKVENFMIKVWIDQHRNSLVSSFNLKVIEIGSFAFKFVQGV